MAETTSRDVPGDPVLTDGNTAVAELAVLAPRFGSSAASRKLCLLSLIAAHPPTGVSSWRTLNDLLCFLRTYPDNKAVRAAADSVGELLRSWAQEGRFDSGASSLYGHGVPRSILSTEYCLPLLCRMFAARPDSLEIDWEAFEDQEPLLYALGLLVTAVECQGLDDVSLPLPEWFRMCRSDSQASDLEFLLELFQKGGLAPSVRDVLFEKAHVPIRYELKEPGTVKCELSWPVGRMHYQKQELDRTRPSVQSVIHRPFRRVERLAPSKGEAVIDLAQRTPCVRDLEIRTLSYANAEDVTLLECGRGIRIALVGVVPNYRDPLECHYCCVVLKNGVPVA